MKSKTRKKLQGNVVEKCTTTKKIATKKDGQQPRKKQKIPKQIPYGKRVKMREIVFIGIGYKATTARVYAYITESLLKKLKQRVVLIKVKANKETGREKRVFKATLVGYKRLQNQPPEEKVIVVVNVETGEEEEIHIADLPQDEEINQKILAERMARKKRRIEAENRKRYKIIHNA